MYFLHNSNINTLQIMIESKEIGSNFLLNLALKDVT